jgi:hypothetical protein
MAEDRVENRSNGRPAVTNQRIVFDANSAGQVALAFAEDGGKVYLVVGGSGCDVSRASILHTEGEDGAVIQANDVEQDASDVFSPEIGF